MGGESAMTDAHRFARLYFTHGRVPLPIALRSKSPNQRGWQNTTLRDVDLRAFEENCNVGVLLGMPSGGLRDVDLDCKEAIALARLLPRTRSCFGRKGKQATHYLYLAPGDHRTVRFVDPTVSSDEATIVELRGDGAQTVFPPSVYPDGEECVWHSTGPPLEIEWEVLRRHVAILASAALLVRHWPAPGSRHEASLALAGALARSRGLKPAEIANLIGDIARTAGDEEVSDRVSAARTTTQRIDSGQNVTGVPTLKKLIEPRVVEMVADWLELGHVDNAIENPGTRRGVLTRLADVEREEVDWLWQGRIPYGCVTEILGDADKGKSTLTLDLAARVSTGRRMPDGSPASSPSDVILVSFEDHAAMTIKPRLEAAGADLGRVHTLSIVSEHGEELPSFPKDLAALEEAISETGAALVVVDPISAALAGSVDSHRDQDVRRVMAPFARIAEKHGAAILVVRHLRKSRGANPLHAGGGSVAFTAAARSALLVGVDPVDSGRRVLARVKGNLAPPVPSLGFRLVPADGTVGVDWLGEVGHTAAELLFSAELDSEKRNERTAAAQFLMEMLVDGPKPVSELRKEAKAAQIGWRTVQRAKTDLDVISVKLGLTSGWMWELPKTASTEDVAAFGEGGGLREESSTYEAQHSAAFEGRYSPEPQAAFEDRHPPAPEAAYDFFDDDFEDLL